jgi:hypothetical protein
MFLKIYYEYSGSCVARSIAFLAVNACLMVFDGLCRSLFFAVFGKLSFICGVLRVKICEFAGVDQAVLIFKHVYGVVFHE